MPRHSMTFFQRPDRRSFEDGNGLYIFLEKYF